MYDNERQLIFIHIARTGGTSVESAIAGSDWWQIDPETKHLSASQAYRQYGQDTWERCSRFTLIRNPYDRVVSMWFTKWWNFKAVELSFLEFVKQLKPHPHEKYNTLKYHEIIDRDDVDIIKFEGLVGNLNSYLSKSGLDKVTLPHVEKRSRDIKDYRGYYCEASYQLVTEIYKKDLSIFDYKFD